MFPMEFWREKMWIWIPAATALGSFILGVTFFLISKYILLKDRSKGFFKPDTARLNVQKNVYQFNEQDLPPLPPRTQFLTADSYESIDERPESKAEPAYVKVDVEEAAFLSPPMKSTGRCHSDDMSTEDYDDIAEENNSKNVKGEFPQPLMNSDDMSMEDYDDIGEENNCHDVKVDVEEAEFPPPPMKSTGSCHSNDTSMEDYDDIGEENNSRNGKVDMEEAEFPPPPLKSTGSCHSDDMSMEDYDDIGEENNSKDGEDYDDVG